MKVKAVKNKISLEGDWVVEHAVEGKSKLMESLDKIDTGKPLSIDLAKVEQIDSSGFQLLLALSQTLQKQDVQFRFTNVREEIFKLVNLAGLNKYLRIDREDVVGA